MKFKVNWLALTVFAFHSAFAGTAPAPASSPNPSPAPSPSPSIASVVHLNADSIRKLMIDGNPSLITQFTQVNEAKDQVRVARNSLFPGVNLSAVLNTNPVSLAIGSLSFLVPFLIPSTWLNYDIAKDNLVAGELGYKIMELNTYSTVYALYETTVEDLSLKPLLQQEANDWQEVLGVITTYYNVGAVDLQTLDNATTQAKGAAASLEAINQAIDSDMANLQYALGVQGQDVVVDLADVPKSNSESMALADAVALSLKVSPELQQLNVLIDAGNAGSWSDVFAWMNPGITGSVGNPYASAGGSGLPDLSTVTPRGSFDFGFAAFPEVSLDQDKTDAIKVSVTELTAQQTETLQAALNGLQDALRQYDDAQQAEASAHDSYEIEKLTYSVGATNLQDLINDSNAAVTAMTQRVQAETSVNTLRITLQRALLENEFAELPGCVPAPGQPVPQESWISKVLHAIGDIFSGAHSTQTLDQLCHSGG
jgi:multidrug efflux system outer membrane protein